MENFSADLLLRWIHFLSGITWIGLLYYFNIVQVPALADAAKDTGGPGPTAISKYIAPRALWWFRWGAVVTWLSGAALLAHRGIFVDAFALGLNTENPSVYVVAIGVGAWLGTIMLLNVWGLIWRNQKKVLGIVAATDDEKARAKRVAFLASRTNVLLSVAMLLFMGASHGLLF
ncbi:MAG: urate hydroxylase PuuD [Xanthomonadaceae bacterium]|nr:urate hydroxylase PuuD [Xanthomonadaceae bacterium]